METYTTVACLDCAQAEINADYTGMGPDRESEVRSARAFLKGDGYRVVVDTDKVNNFSNERCGVCDTTLAGHRFGAVLIPL
jgi:hypothetical protein